MNRAQIAKLTSVREIDAEKFVFVCPGIVATFYIHAAVAKASAAVAETIPRYLKFVGPKAIRGYLAQNGYYKEFSAARLERDMKVMRSASSREPGPDIDYSSEVNGGVGPHGVFVRGSDNNDKVMPLSVTMLRLEFPADALSEPSNVEELLEFLMKEAVNLGAQAGGIGWGLKRAPAFESEATAAINALLPRYLGFDPCYHGFGRQMRGKTPPAQWITFMDKGLFAKCGGAKRLKAIAPTAQKAIRKDLVFLRAAKLPPVGDANRGAKDLGAIPDVARFLKPLRVTIGGLGDNKLDAAAWLARFDDLPAREWVNE